MLQKLAWVWGRSRNQRGLGFAVHLTTGLLLLVGVFFRSNRYWFDPIGLWGDEASWARRLFRHSLTDFEFRPLGYMDVTQLIVHAYSDERTIRVLSYAAGLASLVIVLDIGKYLFRSRSARLLCLAVVVFQPVLIDMSREFKPYSLEFCVHLGLIWLFLRWYASGARVWLHALLVCSSLAFLFAYNIVFLLPAIFGLLGVSFLRGKAYRSFFVTVLAACAALALIASVYFGVLREMRRTDGGEKFWGGKYDVFYLPADAETGKPVQSHFGWLAHKHLELAVFPDVQRDQWRFPEWVSVPVSKGLVAVSYYAWLALHGLGLVALFSPRRRHVLVLLVTPLLLVMTFNWFGVWPFGPFRANTFLLGYYTLIPMVGFDALIDWARRFGWVPALAGYALILMPNLTIGFDSHGRKHFFVGHMETRAVLLRLRELRERESAAARVGKSHVLLDMYSCAPFEFEMAYNDSTRRAFGRYFLDNFQFECMKSPGDTESLLRRLRGKSFFVVVTGDHAKPAMRSLLHKRTTLLDEEQVLETHDLYHATAN